jgi:peptide/nickel transport system substrate-binding protein
LSLLAILLGLVTFAAACGSSNNGSSATTGGGETTTSAAGKSGGTVTYAAEQEYTAYNNASSDNGLFANTLVLNLVQPGPFIVQGDLSFKLYSDMMESAELTKDDPQTIVYKIKKEAVWEDGKPIDCKDFYLAWLSQNGKSVGPDADGDGQPDPVFHAASTTGYDQIKSVTCSTDLKTVTAVFDTPFADWKGLFGALMPAHVLEAGEGIADITKVTNDSPDATKAADFWNNKWNGYDPAADLSGAWYRIKSFNQGQDLTLERNPKYYGKPGLLDTVVFKLVADATAEPQALQNGEVQVISPQPNTDLVAQIAGISDATAEVDEGTTFEHIDFNFKNPILADLEVRKAIALCINRQELIDTLIKPLSDKATVLNNRIFLSNQKGYKDNSGPYAKQDLEKAKSTLEADGWTDTNGDGIREKNGQTLSIRIGRRDPNPRRQQEIQLFQTQCKPAGIDFKEDASEDFNSDRLPAGDYDIALFAWVGTPLLSSNSSIYKTDGGQNYQKYNDDKINQMFDDANAEFDDSKRVDDYNKIDQLLWTDVATVPLFQFPDMIAWNNSVQNVEYNGANGVTWNGNAWFLSS